MVTVCRIILFALVTLTACNFNEGSFGDRSCTINDDCRPDQACVANTCAQKTCTTKADCGNELSVDCTEVGCVAQECSDTAPCGTGFLCNEENLCAANFNVSSATSTTNTTIDVAYDGPPDPAAAETAANYSVPGLTVVSAVLTGTTVTLETSPQAAMDYTVAVANVLRIGDGVPLKTASATFAGRSAFGVATAVSASNLVVTVTYDAPPDPAAAMTLTNYDIPGLTLIGTPVLLGNIVTLGTSPQSQQSYTLTISNVRRAADQEALTTPTATFTGRSAFKVDGAASLASSLITVTFDAPPDSAQATNIANYQLNNGLTFTGAPVLAGSTVTIATSAQAAISYTVAVSNVTRASDGEALAIDEAVFTGINTFNVASAGAISAHSVLVTFDAAPGNGAGTAANYSIPGLTISSATVSGSTVTLATSPQTASSFTLTVSNVTRSGDNETLSNATATFTGRAPFNVAGAVATTSTLVAVTFSAAPDPALAMTLSNYNITGLTLSGTPVLSGNTVTITTSPQTNSSFTVTVSNVLRDSDDEALTTASATFTGRAAFKVTSAVALDSHTVRVFFDAAPNDAQGTTLANYNVVGLTLLGTPVLAGNNVTIQTSPQTVTGFTITVGNVTRASDGEALSVNSANFTGISTFNVVSAVALTSHTVRITFDAVPEAITAGDITNYEIAGLTIGSAVVSGTTVTLTTSAQSASQFTVNVIDVIRSSDSEALTIASAAFTGRTEFNVTSAVSTTSTRVIITFDAAPNATQAQTLSSYNIPGLTLSGTPVLSGNSVTLQTSPQADTAFTVTVTGVTRNSDSEPLTTTNASFTGRPPYNVLSAVATTSTTVVLTFDAAPDAAQATTLANYSIAGLTLANVPILAGNQVTLTTSAQAAQTFAVVVSGVTRALDGEALTVTSANFTGRPPFNVTSVASTSNVSMTVSFDAPPTAAQATNLANYNINPSLTLSNPVLAGNTVTFTTSSQIVTPYTVVVSNVQRASDSEALTTNSGTFTGKTGFNVASAASVNSTTMSVTFDAPPNAAQATTRANYNVPGLTLSGTPTLSGSTVTITTSSQAAATFTVTVSNVTRAIDNAPLAVTTASFTHVSFNVTGAASLTTRRISVTFDAAPNAAQATTLANYNVPGLTLSGVPVLAGNTVTLTTSTQSASTFTITVNNVTRASDGTVLTVKTASFTGRAPFNVASAASTSSGSMTVTFSDAPTATEATTLANYSVNNGLVLSGTPILSGNVVTLTTTAQAAISYTVTVSNVTRASDVEALTTTSASFTGTALQVPTVTNVVVQTTVPDNGTKFFNTGTATVIITGTNFTGVDCLNGVALDDLNGAGVAANTKPTACTVNSGTQITATFPSGIRTNGSLGWNVKVTNAVGTNATSTIKLVPFAGLLISEVFVGKVGATDREFVELYNPTGTPLKLNSTNLGLRLHIRASNGTDVDVALNFVDANCNPAGNCEIPSHGYFMIASQQTTSAESWFTLRDATYNAATAQLVTNGGVYISLSATAQTKVIDKLGWGNQPAPGFEFDQIGNIADDRSTQRKPAGGLGATTDTDDNSTDFLAPVTTINPQGSISNIEP